MNDMLVLNNEYESWKNEIVNEIHSRQFRTVLNVNADTLQNYFEIGKKILDAQEEKGWGSHVIDQLSKDLEKEFGKNNGYSVRNLRNMKIFAEEYPDFPIWQVPLAELNGEKVQVPLTQITWYHHISLISKVKDKIERAFYIKETAENGWSRDVTEYGKISPQMKFMSSNMLSDEISDNNCQNLNIWTPGLDKKKRAVMVWLHGGGFIHFFFCIFHCFLQKIHFFDDSWKILYNWHSLDCLQKSLTIFNFFFD